MRKTSTIRKHKEGRGKGEGANYKPWLTVRDVPSRGRKHRISGKTVDRHYSVLSDNERNVVFVAEFGMNVVQIQEQMPLLPISKTISIAESLNIPHPKFKKENVVMTTDFLITIINEQNRKEKIAISYKPSWEFSDRNIAKMQLEKSFWEQRRGGPIKWTVWSEEQINSILLHNISLLREYFDGEYLKKEPFIEALNKNESPKSSIAEVVRSISKELKITSGVGKSIFMHLLSHKVYSFDYYKTFSWTMAFDQFQFSK
jgi:hypothetical protein